MKGMTLWNLLIRFHLYKDNKERDIICCLLVAPINSCADTPCQTPINTMHKGRKINFGAGPAQLPLGVLEQFTRDLIDFEGSGVGVGELSHRTPLFERDILEKANESLMKLTGCDEREWSVLWMTGGGTGQFAAVPMNFANDEGIAVYLVTGTWSEKAADEAKRILGEERVRMIDLRIDLIGRRGLREFNSERLNGLGKRVLYVYYCDNETVDGIELGDPDFFKIPNDDIPVIVDMSSNFLSRRIARSASLVFAGVQKNLGAAGVTVVLIRKSLLGMLKVAGYCPSVMDYRLTAKSNSLLNTPPVTSIHLCNLVLKDLRSRYADLDELDEFSRKKSDMLYATIEESDSFYCPIAKGFRSRMNVVFKLKSGSADEEAAFLAEAAARGMIQLKGHRSVGGLRASLYNAVSLKEVEVLCELIHGKSKSNNESEIGRKSEIERS